MAVTTKIIQPGINTASEPGAWSSVVQQVLWGEGRAAEDALHANETLKTAYLGKFHDWWLNYDNNTGVNQSARTIPPPQPPKSFVALVTETTYENGSVDVVWDLAQQGAPVCDMPPYPKEPGDPTMAPPPPPPAPVFDVNDAVNADPPARDGMPIGFTVTQPDGSKWVKKARALPFGTAYLWVRVS